MHSHFSVEPHARIKAACHSMNELLSHLRKVGYDISRLGVIKVGLVLFIDSPAAELSVP